MYKNVEDVIADCNNDSVFWCCGQDADTTSSSPITIVYRNVASKTTDIGMTWTYYYLPATNGVSYALAIDPTNSDVVYAGGYESISYQNYPRVFKTTDGGTNWLDHSTGISGTVTELAHHPQETNILYAGTASGVFKTVDGGDSWTNVGCANVYDIVIDPYAPDTVYAGTGTGVYISTDAGATWASMNQGLGDTVSVPNMEIDPGAYLYAGTYGHCMFRWTLDTLPPHAPSIVQIEKSGSDAILQWNKVTTDALDNPETMDHYVVYRSTSPSFIPDPLDSIGVVVHPDTTFTDIDALTGTQNYYYLVKAVDKVANRSKNSNMGYVFKKFLNENPATTDRNWVSLPWHNNYAVVSALTSDLSSAGDPLVKVTNLRDDQKYESWIWDPDFGEWYGTDFAITSGRGYEMVTVCDTVVILVGCNEPAGLVVLNENPAITDRNWISIPYNHAYSAVSDIMAEYSVLGYPLTKMTNLRDDNKYESWIWDPDFGEWYGTNFVIERGRGYEMVTVVDTVWDPTEFSNESGLFFARPSRQTNISMRLGTALLRDRAPVWVEDKKVIADVQRAKGVEQSAKSIGQSAGGLSHIVRVHIDMKDFENLVFTAYCPDNPYDVLTETMVGCGSAEKQGSAALWFDVGNFEKPWVNGEELLVIVEATKQGQGYFTVVSFVLDNTVDVQDIGTISLVSISDLNLDDENIIGYSMYKGDKRLNTHVLTVKDYRVDNDVVIRPVFRGGYETVYANVVLDHQPQAEHIPPAFAFSAYPNPCAEQIRISYALPYTTDVSIALYDVTGRHVRQLVSQKQTPGYYSLVWNTIDNTGRVAASGVYFVRICAGQNIKQEKILLVR